MNRGFTLIEVAVCLVILGLLTGTAALSLRDMQQNIDLKTWTERLAALDHQTRERAESQGKPWHVVVDLKQQLVWGESTNKTNQDNGVNALSTPDSWELFAAKIHRGSRKQTVVTSGQEVVPYTTTQVSHSYALGLRNDDDQTFWLMIAGGTGQILTTDNEKKIKDIFAAMHATGDDAS